MKKLRSVPLYIRILLGMVAGIAIGFGALSLNAGQFVSDWIAPWGKLFIRLLQLIAVPLIFVTLVKGIAGLKDVSRFSWLGGRTMGLYLIFITAAVIFGIGMGISVKPGSYIDPSTVVSLQQQYQEKTVGNAEAAEAARKSGPLYFLNEIVPNNIFLATTDNTKMLQVIFFAILFAVAALMLPQEKTRSALEFFDSMNEIIMKMVGFIISLAPIGVTALMAELVVSFKGDGSVFLALGVYALTVTVAMLMIMYIFYPIVIHFFSRKSVKDFLKAMYPVQLFAFTTSSSAVTLPVTMKAIEEKLKVPKEISTFVLPVGVTINMDGTSCYQSIAIFFIAQALGVDLNFMQIMTILFMTILSSIGTPGIPGGSYVILAMVLTSVGIPAAGLALIIGIDRPLDMLRTAVNVTGDAAVACMIRKDKE